MPEKEIKFCPNCQQPALWDGKKLVCEICDVTFIQKPGGGARVEQLGRIEKIEQRVTQIEQTIGPAEPEPEPEPDEPTPDEPGDQDEENENEVWRI